MSIGVVARKDFQDAIRAKTLWVAVAVFALFISLSTWFFSNSAGQSGSIPGEALLLSLFLPVSFLLPIIGIMLGYKAIVGERTSGTIKLLLSLPNTRKDTIIGKLIGRSGVVAATVVLGSIIGGIVFIIFAGSFPAVDFVLFVLMSILLGTVFVSIAVGFSAATKSDTVAIIGGIGLALLFTVLWGIFRTVFVMVLREVFNFSGESLLEARSFVNALNPRGAYSQLLVELLTDGSSSGQTATMVQDGFYTEPWFAVIVLLFWFAVPLAFGYWRFERAELG